VVVIACGGCRTLWHQLSLLLLLLERGVAVVLCDNGELLRL
jgi:hypothetical protein